MKEFKDERADLCFRQVDQELSAKIASELQMEQEIRETDKLPVNISDYLDSCSFEVIKPTSQLHYHSYRKLTCGKPSAP